MNEFTNICFLGGGSWGQSLAISLARAGFRSSVIVSDPKRKKTLNENKSSCFPNLKFPNLISAFTKKTTLKNCELVFICTQSYRVEESLEQIININPNIKIVITSKGFANTNGETFPEIIIKKYPKLTFGVLTGPTFADEVAKNLPSAAIIASKDKKFSNNISKLFSKTSLRLYMSNDPIGASIAGAIKNIIAIGAGISEGLSLGNNAKAGLITRGIAETSMIITACGGKKETAFGLAGIGDMTLTCSTPHSRNMNYGINLTRSSDDMKINKLVEGIYALKAAKNISKRLDIETPIIDSINDIVNNKKEIKIIINELFNRPIKTEFNLS